MCWSTGEKQCLYFYETHLPPPCHFRDPIHHQKIKEATEWKKISIATGRMMEQETHLWGWWREKSHCVFILFRLLSQKILLFLFSQRKVKKNMLMLFLPLKNIATSEFSQCIKCKPLLLLFCSHNYFSNQQFLHVWCIFGGTFDCLYSDWNVCFSNSIINSILLWEIKP